MSLERWEPGLAQKLDPVRGLLRFTVVTPNGEVFIAIGREELVRISMQRVNRTYCVFEIPLAKVADFFDSGKYGLGDFGDAIYEDPVVSNLTREQAMELLGIKD